MTAGEKAPVERAVALLLAAVLVLVGSILCGGVSFASTTTAACLTIAEAAVEAGPDGRETLRPVAGRHSPLRRAIETKDGESFGEEDASESGIESDGRSRRNELWTTRESSKAPRGAPPLAPLALLEADPIRGPPAHRALTARSSARPARQA